MTNDTTYMTNDQIHGRTNHERSHDHLRREQEAELRMVEKYVRTREVLNSKELFTLFNTKR